MSTQTLRVAIVSANWGVHGHLPAWRGLPGVEVVGICTAHKETAEKAAREHNIPRAFWDYRAMMDDPDIDIVNLGTRPVLRYDMAMRALESGKHVFNSIPFAMNLEQSRAMVDLQRAKKLIGQVDAQFQWVPAITRMREMIEEGFLGELFSVTCHVHIQLTFNQAPAFPYKWLADVANGASGLRNMGAHGLHALVYLFGEIEDVVGQYDTFTKEWRGTDGSMIRAQVPDTGSVLLRFRRGGMGLLNASWAVADATGVFIEAYGSRGRLVIRSVGFPGTLSTRLYAGEVTKHDAHVEREVEIPQRLLTIPGSTIRADDPNKVALIMGRAFNDMLRAIRSGGDAAPSFATAHHVQRTMEAIHKSQETRAWVRVEDMKP
jgi:predicted dehydrogenase